MRKFFSAAAVSAAVIAGAAVATPAAAINFVGNFTVTQYQSGSSNGLEIDLSRTTGNLNFNLTSTWPTDYEYVKLFDIWAGEDIDDGSDETPRDFKVNFNFTQPTVGGTVEGETQGVYQSRGPEYGTLEWDGNNHWSYGFGNGGILNIWMFDTEFGEGQNKKGEVYAKFYLEKMPTSAVPEPATWAMMIGGFGLAGAALRRQRRTAVAAA